MLRDLRIQNFAIIEDLSLCFDKGLNIITGDTGAGKSVLVGALGLILGGRGSPEMIRTKADQARITATFDLRERPDQIERIRNLGIEVSDGEVMIHRTLGRSSKNRVTVNGDPTTVGLLVRLGENLVDIHGQHEHHSLLNAESHIDLLDDYGKIIPQLSRYQEIYHQLKHIAQELHRIDKESKDREQHVDFLQYQIREIDEFNPREGEEEELIFERDLLRNAERISTLSQEAYNMLYDNEGSISDLFGQTLSRLHELASLDSSAQVLVDEGEGMKVQLQEMSHALRDRASNIEPDPDRLTWIEERLERLNRLKRKYGSSMAEILAFRQESENELARLNGSEENQLKLQETYHEAIKQAGKAAADISKLRTKAAQKMEKELERELGDLSMAGTRFQVRLETQKGVGQDLCDDQGRLLTSKGMDKVEFLVSPNVGEEPRPLVRIASGGELSRIMLTIKTVLAEVDRIGILIFDEIDTGIGGGVAETLGRRLRYVAKGRQVICVTHLPQVASQGETHHHISKLAHKGRTRVAAKQLEGKERIAEIARMLGGVEITKTTVKHAQEMLEHSEK